jgi:hypothetical protein
VTIDNGVSRASPGDKLGITDEREGERWGGGEKGGWREREREEGRGRGKPLRRRGGWRGR